MADIFFPSVSFSVAKNNLLTKANFSSFLEGGGRKMFSVLERTLLEPEEMCKIFCVDILNPGDASSAYRVPESPVNSS